MTAPAPLLTAEQATTLLERVLVEQVMEQVDLEALFNVRCSLASAIAALAPRQARAPSSSAREHGATLVDTAADIASTAAIEAQIDAMTDEMMARALRRVPEEALRYLRAEAELDDDCPLCEDAACTGAACIVPARVEIVRPGRAAGARPASRGAR